MIHSTSLSFHARVSFSPVLFSNWISRCQNAQSNPQSSIAGEIRMDRVLPPEYRRDRLPLARIAPLSVAAFSEGDAVPQIRPRVCFNSRSTLGLDSRHPALTSFTIPHAGARCIRVLVSPILRLHTYANAYSHVRARARALVHTCARVARVIPRCSLRTRDTAEVMREPGRIVLVRLYYATSPSIHRPLFILLSPLCLSFSRLCQVGFFVATARFALVSLYTFIDLVTTSMIASFLKVDLYASKV